jgi:hypothetical protein
LDSGGGVLEGVLDVAVTILPRGLGVDAFGADGGGGWKLESVGTSETLPEDRASGSVQDESSTVFGHSVG